MVAIWRASFRLPFSFQSWPIEALALLQSSFGLSTWKLRRSSPISPAVLLWTHRKKTLENVGPLHPWENVVTDKPSQPVVLARFGCFSLPCSESSSLLYSLLEMILRLVLSILLKL